MTLARTLSTLSLAIRSPWRRSAAIVLALAALPAAAQNQLWVRQLGTSAFEWTNAAAPDGSGGVYVSGETDGSFGGPNAGARDAWLARYDGAGSQLWVRQLGTSNFDSADAAAPDGSGGVYVSGRTWGSLGGPNPGSYDAWLARYDSAGNKLWVRQFGTSASDYPTAAAPDGSGGVFVSGHTHGSLGGPNAGGEDAWLARYDGAGNPLWIRQLGTKFDEWAYAAAPDDSGGVYIGGSTLGSLGGPHAGSWDAWLARYDSAGNQLWIRQLGMDDGDGTDAAAPDASGGVYVSGWTEGDLGGPNAGSWDAWLARYDSAGNQLGVRQLGTSVKDRAHAAATDASGGVYVSGLTLGSLGGPSAGGGDAWLARYEECGLFSSYCTAKTNSAGCLPAIAAGGTPSASAGSGFTISTTSVLDNKFGLYFYGKSGSGSFPFQGGTLCAQPPLVRTMLQNSGGTAPCGGSFQIDFNAYVASGRDPALVAGQQVWAQTWSRDPGFAPPNNTSLSDAVSFTLCQ